ncbi:MAG: tryptophan 2,3-dioxygenase [Longimicrobiales bacterium]
MAEPLNYSSYLRLDELLSLQTPRSDGPQGPEHDEMLFIVVHQAYELWFKQILHELNRMGELLARDDTVRVRHTMKRVLTILKVLVAQIDILETMTPLEFLTFRDRLESGSGFQSFQFRALEFMMGNKRLPTVEHYPEGTPARDRLTKLFEQPTIWDAFLAWLARAGYDVPKAQLERDVRKKIEPDPALQEVLLQVYRTDANARELCERLVDLDEGVQEWRYRHVKMVERTIGAKVGTGGSEGAAYLVTTLMKPAFPDLWEIRTEL